MHAGLGKRAGLLEDDAYRAREGYKIPGGEKREAQRE